ncbi:MAG: PTS sugar transporter subunit IIA [Gammaproteobacteria bacterium]
MTAIKTPNPTTQLLFIAHSAIGNAILNAARGILGELPLPVVLLNIEDDTPVETINQQLKHYLTTDNHDWLILVDLYGATPSNIALSFTTPEHVQMVSGLNLPMVLKVMNYAHLPLKELAQKALTGGKNGIIDCRTARTA